MSDCWNCQKKNACGKLYIEGEQEKCLDKSFAYISYENYAKWLAISKDFYIKDTLIIKGMC